MNKVAINEAGFDLKVTILESINELGGFDRFLKSGERVLVKPNINTADPPPASTDPSFLAAFVDLLHEHGAAQVTIGESSTFYDITTLNLQRSGVAALAESRPWLNVISFDEGEWVKRAIPNGKYLKSVRVPSVLDDYDRLFFVCCLKTHFCSQFTGSIKLSVGLMKPQERLALHLRHLQLKVAELASVFSPDLCVMDARKCFITKGPTKGEVREPNLVLASTSRVALDIEGIKIIQQYDGNDLAGVVPEELPQIKRALELNIT
ncbi:MAG: DUF362 domain-containing protein [Patescibacteria group bacterium]